ncbi:hypothetical protein ACFPRL_07390 [Pseudoclavibacter helvolus]
MPAQDSRSRSGGTTRSNPTVASAGPSTSTSTLRCRARRSSSARRGTVTSNAPAWTSSSTAPTSSARSARTPSTSGEVSRIPCGRRTGTQNAATAPLATIRTAPSSTRPARPRNDSRSRAARRSEMRRVGDIAF